jgi:hypothetical protein
LELSSLTSGSGFNHSEILEFLLLCLISDSFLESSQLIGFSLIEILLVSSLVEKIDAMNE